MNPVEDEPVYENPYVLMIEEDDLETAIQNSLDDLGAVPIEEPLGDSGSAPNNNFSINSFGQGDVPTLK